METKWRTFEKARCAKSSQLVKSVLHASCACAHVCLFTATEPWQEARCVIPVLPRWKGGYRLHALSVTRGLSAEHRMPSALQAEFKCPFSFQLSTVRENVQTINRIDFLKYCACLRSLQVSLFIISDNHSLSELPFSPFAFAFNKTASSSQMSGFSLLFGLTQLALQVGIR